MCNCSPATPDPRVAELLVENLNLKNEIDRLTARLSLYSRLEYLLSKLRITVLANEEEEGIEDEDDNHQ